MSISPSFCRRLVGRGHFSVKANPGGDFFDMAPTHREVTRIMQKLVASKSPKEKKPLLWWLNEWGASRDRVEFSYTFDGLLKVECFNGTRARLPQAVTSCADLLVSNGSVVKSRMGEPRILSALERVAQSVDVV